MREVGSLEGEGEREWVRWWFGEEFIMDIMVFK